MSSRVYFAPAKVNLALDVLGTRQDGYHELDGVMASLDWGDTLAFSPGKDVQVTFCGMEAPRENTVTRAVVAYQKAAGKPRAGAHIQVIKRTPHEAGLGGGSADGAAAIRAMEDAYGPLSSQIREEVACSVGADVPFCLAGGLCRSQGIGERLTALPACPAELWLLLVKPRQGISTAALFGGLEETGLVHPDVPAVMAALQAGDLAWLGQAMGNALEGPGERLLPVLGRIKSQLLEAGALGAVMTGSGSTMVGLFPGREQALAARHGFGEYPFVQVARAGA